MQAERQLINFHLRFQPLYTKNLEISFHYRIYSSTQRIYSGQMHDLSTCFRLVYKQKIQLVYVITCKCAEPWPLFKKRKQISSNLLVITEQDSRWPVPVSPMRPLIGCSKAEASTWWTTSSTSHWCGHKTFCTWVPCGCHLYGSYRFVGRFFLCNSTGWVRQKYSHKLNNAKTKVRRHKRADLYIKQNE